MSSAIYTPARIPSPLTATQSHVQFGPLSPQSSQTLLHLRATRSVDNVNNTKAAEDKDNQQASSGSDAESAIVPKRRFRKRRRNSDPSANRPLVSRHRDGPVESDRSSSPPEEEIEVLPDRFDTHGQPIDGSVPMGSSSSRHRGWTQRQGEFEYRSPRPGGSQVRGSWGVAGSDPEHVERVMREVTGALSGDIPRGVGGWLGLASKLLGGAMGGHASLHDEERQADEGSSGDGGNGSWRRHDTGKEQNSRRGWSNKEEHDDDDRIDRGASGYGGGGSDMSRDERGKGRRRTDDHGYDNNNEDENGLAGNGARRRRRRRRRDMD
ncbi:hypothetical protein BD289DRAFT_64493 [Coniella lustricola]|uniref:Uncharacterized protein n=1 Tax=Coniella lustricola TaxID=2025994 RepID=A0A2T3AHT3_9PEZI|nr:hypothetical protein BD289DRAFT_64493 [Coniella lustricola]